MKIITNLNTKIKDETVICLGSFDGLHLGHQALIKNALLEANNRNIKSAVFTFSNHPASIITNKDEPNLLVDNKQKTTMLRDFGLDYLLMVEFNENIMKIKPEDFVKKILVDNMNVRKVIVGFNYRFGHKGKGNTEVLNELGDKYGFEVEILSPVMKYNQVISSTLIRSLISKGEIKDANKLLGFSYTIKGQVVDGKKRGKSMGFPTANLKLKNNYVIPRLGVYKTKTIVGSNEYLSVTSVGKNPTFKNDNKISIETYLINFDKNIYNENITVKFVNFIREEIKFENKDELIQQMKKDINYVLNK